MKENPYKKLLAVLMILIVLYILLQCKQGEDQTILKELLKRGEYCKIVKNFQSEYFLFCNERPFYAKYENNTLYVKENGWSFLNKDEKLSKDLKGCDYYTTKKEGKDYKIIFYCPEEISLHPEKLVAKIYDFNPENFEMKKEKEEDFLKILSNDIKDFYNMNCEFRHATFDDVIYNSVQIVALNLTFDCDDGVYQVLFSLTDSNIIQPPIKMGNESEEKRIETSFKKFFKNCSLKKILNSEDEIILEATCNNYPVNFTYTPYRGYFFVKTKIKFDNTSFSSIKSAVLAIKDYIIFPRYDFSEIEKVEGEKYILGEKVFYIVSCEPNTICAIFPNREKIFLYYTMIRAGEEE